MSATFLLSLVLVAAEPAKAQPPFHEYEQAISAAFKQDSQSKLPAQRAAAVRELCDLHERIVHDTRYATSDVLKEYRGRIWSRLLKVKAELVRELSRDPANQERLRRSALLAAADKQAVAEAVSLGERLTTRGAAQGGAGSWAAFGGGAVPPDWGPDLVDLIERTINPAFWDVAGGPGSIYYYQPLHCLVIRATSEVHAQIGGVVGDLRAAGR
jgi:hypothetical protein